MHLESEMPFKVRKTVEIRNRYNLVAHLTQDIKRESDKSTIKYHTQDRQEVSHFPAGDHKAAMNKQQSMTNTNINNKNDQQKKHRLGMVSKMHNIIFFQNKKIIINNMCALPYLKFSDHYPKHTYFF